MPARNNKRTLIDGSRLIVEALVRSGAEVYIGYPITPANWLYGYAQQWFPLFLAAPDEITALQWAAGFSATGKLPVTATAFPGLALMLETLNMAFMMELPIVIILAQRMGPSTGSATTGAQGDLLLLRGCISGGYAVPIFCPADLTDCWLLSARCVTTALDLRTPVVLLTSKEMIMTIRSFDLTSLPEIPPSSWRSYQEKGPYIPYQAEESGVPPFLPVGNNRHRVRLNASTHDASGLIRKATLDALNNTRRLQHKIVKGASKYIDYQYDQDEASDTLILTYGISVDAARDALRTLRSRGHKVSLLIMKTIIPIPSPVLNIMDKHAHIVIVEENLGGLLREILYGHVKNGRISSVNQIGNMITPTEIVKEVEACQTAS